MIYRSNLKAPDLQPYFRHVICEPMGHSQGHDVLRDFADRSAKDPVFGVYKLCGFWTHDEAAILYNAAQKIGGAWLDVGGLTGWTACHLAAACCKVYSVDPMYANAQFRARAEENITAAGFRDKISLWACTSSEFFAKTKRSFDGIVIDGEHSSPIPAQDAANAMARVSPAGIILFHDANAYQIRKACRSCGSAGWQIKNYKTPHGVALCYRGGFVPPEHTPDPRIA